MSARAPLLVGLVLVAATVSLTWFVLGTSKDRFSESQTYPLFADFSDASGIRAKTRLQINGIDVGKIEDITHVRGPDGKLVARVELWIAKEYDIYENAVLRKAAESLLGDFRLDLDPGTPNYAKIPERGLIKNVQSRSDLEEIQAQLKQVSQNVNNVTQSLSRVLAGPEGEGSLKDILNNVNRSMVAIEQTTRILADMVARNDQAIDKMIADLGQFSASLAHTTGPGGDIQQVAENLRRISEKLDRVASSAEEVLGPDGGVGEQQGELRRAISNINRSAESLSSIAKKIDEGQGTLGRVVNDPTLINRVEDTLADVQQLTGGISRLQTEIELRTQYEVPFYTENEQIQAAVKNVLGVRIVPRPDKYYILEAISDPRGTSTRKIVSESALEGNTDPLINKEINEISFNTLKFSAQFAKRYYFATLRFGIIENTGGVGMDLHFLEDRLELRIDAFDFTRRDLDNTRINPRLRSTAMVGFVEHLFVQAGIDDPFNRDLRTWFVGGVLRFTDEDLKALLTVAPSP